jgi:hypothetical protein
MVLETSVLSTFNHLTRLNWGRGRRWSSKRLFYLLLTTWRGWTEDERGRRWSSKRLFYLLLTTWRGWKPGRILLHIKHLYYVYYDIGFWTKSSGLFKHLLHDRLKSRYMTIKAIVISRMKHNFKCKYEYHLFIQLLQVKIIKQREVINALKFGNIFLNDSNKSKLRSRNY